LGLVSAILLASMAALAPLKPVTSIDLSKQGSLASDVAWLDDDDVLVALIDGGVAKVSLKSKEASRWIPQGSLPGGTPYAELVATDGNVIVVMGGGNRNYMFRNRDRRYLYGYMGGRLNPRGVAVVGGKAIFMGWMGQAGTDETLRRGVLWTEAPGEPISETPMHRILGGDDKVARWRLTAHPYGGSMVALPDGSVAVMTSAEPGIYRYHNGRLAEVLASGVDSLILDSQRVAHDYAMDVEGRYTQVLNRQKTIDDLVATPQGIAILVRSAASGMIGWELWRVGPKDVVSRQPLGLEVRGPFAHMRCEARAERLACVTNLPDAAQAKKPETAGANPRLIVFRFAR
jgi:hypothetical protein